MSATTTPGKGQSGTQTRRQVPVVAGIRQSALSGFVGSALGTVVVLLSPIGWGGSGGESGLSQVLFLMVFGLFCAIMTFNPKIRSHERAFREAAIPVVDPDALRRAYAITGRSARVREALRPGVITLAFVLVAGFGIHSPWIGLGPSVFATVTLVDAWTLSRWQRCHGVVVWRHFRGTAGLAAIREAPYYTTPAP